MMTFLIKVQGRRAYTKRLPSNAAAVHHAQVRYPGAAPASVVNLVMPTGRTLQADQMRQWVAQAEGAR